MNRFIMVTVAVLGACSAVETREDQQGSPAVAIFRGQSPAGSRQDPTAPVVPEALAAAPTTSVSGAGDGRSTHWSSYSDADLFAIGSSRDSVYAVGLKAPGSSRGMDHGHVTMAHSQWLSAIHGVSNVPGVTIVRADSVTIPYVIAKITTVSTLSLVRNLPFVDYVEPAKRKPIAMDFGDCVYPGGVTSGGQSAYNDTLIVAPYQSPLPDVVANVYPSMGILNAWNLTTGGGTTVGVTDTGLDTDGSSEFSTANFASGESAGRSLTYWSGWPVCSHGTRIAGLVAAPKNGHSTVGVAYRANLIVADQADGEIPDAEFAADAIDLVSSAGARVVVMAWGEPTWYDVIANKISNYYYNHDVMFVGAAGTCLAGLSICPHMDSAVFPAEMEEVLAVSGANHDGSRPGDMYNWGSKSGVLAYTNLATTGMRTSTIVNISGSSGATGLIGGVAALVRARNPALTNRQVMDHIIQTSGSRCGAPNAWRLAMVNASAAVGGPCVWSLVGPVTYYINDPVLGTNPITDVSAFVDRYSAGGLFVGGSGSYHVDWVLGQEVVSHGETDGDYTDASGNIMFRAHQRFSFLPAYDGAPYLSVLTAHVHDLSLGTDDIRQLNVLVCPSPSNCAATTRPFPPPYGATIGGVESFSVGDFGSWTANVHGGTPPYTYSWTGLFTGSSSSINGTLTQGGNLNLDVWDSTGLHTSTSAFIFVNQCPNNEISC